jgi:hypothetical protein
VSGEGLLPEPWVRLEMADGAVRLDGEFVVGPGTVEDRYLEALRRVSEDVAAPLGRPVGLRVEGRAGEVTNLAVYPDGRADSISDLVAAATPAVAVSAEVAPYSRPPRQWRPRARRSVGLLGAVAAATVVSAVGLTALFSSDDAADGSPAPAPAPRILASAPAVAPGPAVSAATVLEARPVITATARPLGPRTIALRLVSSRPVVVTVRFHPDGGDLVTRQVRLRGDPRRLVLSGLPVGVATYRVAAPQAIGARGRVRVLPAPTPPDPPSSVVSAPAPPAAASNGSGSGGSGGAPGAAPVIPIDPDD